jgi:hypothetical protein
VNQFEFSFCTKGRGGQVVYDPFADLAEPSSRHITIPTYRVAAAKPTSSSGIPFIRSLASVSKAKPGKAKKT